MPAWPGARITLTANRCATLVKFPVALSGGSNACNAPEAGPKLSTVPWNFLPGTLSTVTDRRLTRVHVRHLGFAKVGDDPNVRQRHDEAYLAPRSHVFSRQRFPI